MRNLCSYFFMLKKQLTTLNSYIIIMSTSVGISLNKGTCRKIWPREKTVHVIDATRSWSIIRSIFNNWIPGVVSELATYELSVFITPIDITHCHPIIIIVDLHSTIVVLITIRKPYVILALYVENIWYLMPL